MEVAVTAFLNEVAVKDAEEKCTCDLGKNLRKGRFEEILKRNPCPKKHRRKFYCK